MKPQFPHWFWVRGSGVCPRHVWLFLQVTTAIPVRYLRVDVGHFTISPTCIFSHPGVDRIWLWIFQKILAEMGSLFENPIYMCIYIYYLLQDDYI